MTKTNPDEYRLVSEDKKRQIRQLKTAIYICLLLSTLVAYEPVRHNDFVLYDDYANVAKNPHVNNGITRQSVIWAFTNTYLSNWYPLTWLSHMLDFEIFGSDPAGHHLTSVLIHTVSSLLLFMLLFRMTAAIWPSAFAAAVFALHPLHVESVAWVAERKDVLSGLFWIATMLAYVYYAERPSFSRYTLVLTAFVMGIMSKPMVVTLPFVLLLLDYWPLERFGMRKKEDTFQKTSAKRLIAEKIPLFAMSAILSIVTFIAQKHSGAVSTLENVSIDYRVANTFISYIRYIQKTVWPSKLAVIYPLQGAVSSWDMGLVCAIAFILITSLSIYIGRRRKYILVGWLWYVGTLVPVIGLVHVGSQAMADRYMYLPMAGLLIIAGWGLKDFVGNRRPWKVALAVLAGAILLFAIILTRIQVRYWQNSITLFEHTLKVTTNNSVAEDNYGNALIDAGKADEGLLHLRNGVRISPSAFLSRIELARALLHLGKYKESVECFNALTNYKEVSAEVFGDLGTAQMQLGRYEQAIENLNKAIQMDSKNTEMINNLGWVLATCENASLRNPDKAIALAKRACELTKYKNASPLDTLAAAYAAAGSFDKAVIIAQQAIDIIKNSKDSEQKKIIDEIQKHLELYKKGQACIEKQNLK
ncbi:MAG: tetratricopeptide repeat protein [Sedimentisphaerales bacterium]